MASPSQVFLSIISIAHCPPACRRKGECGVLSPNPFCALGPSDAREFSFVSPSPEIARAQFCPTPRDEMTALRTRSRRHLAAAAVILSVLVSALGQECNNDTMRRCRRNINEELNSNGRSDRNDVDGQCRTLRENFDCLLWQTSMCLDKSGQESNRDEILRAWRFLSSFCESQGNWYTKQCFQKKEVKSCEALLPSRGYSTDTSSCRSYSSFRDCVTTIVQGQCSVSDQRLLGTYLMEKGQQRAWNCPRNSDPLARNNPASAPLAADVDTRYTSLSEASYGYCSDESRYALQDCRESFYSSQREAQTRNDSDMRNHKTCCAMVHYEDCVTTTLEDRCGDRGRTEARNIVSDMKSRYPYYNCNDHTMNECNSATLATATFLINALVTLASILVLKKD